VNPYAWSVVVAVVGGAVVGDLNLSWWANAVLIGVVTFVALVLRQREMTSIINAILREFRE
jgi:hypothetical protein